MARDSVMLCTVIPDLFSNYISNKCIAPLFWLRNIVNRYRLSFVQINRKIFFQKTSSVLVKGCNDAGGLNTWCFDQPPIACHRCSFSRAYTQTQISDQFFTLYTLSKTADLKRKVKRKKGEKIHSSSKKTKFFHCIWWKCVQCCFEDFLNSCYVKRSLFSCPIFDFMLTTMTLFIW